MDNHVVITPGICSGKPRIAGHRITVQNVVLWHERGGLSPDEIASRYRLSLAEVYAALAYYFDHRDEIEAQILADANFAEELRAQTVSPLQEKMAQQNGPHDSLPPG